jgi:trehalose 6-phosphate phosphatase
LRSTVAGLRAQPGRSALFLDYDGTLAPIVEDPAQAVPVVGAPRVLAQLADSMGLVAVVSGRPASFLGAVLGAPTGLRMIGLYGLEEVDTGGGIRTATEALPWRAVAAELTAAARQGAPTGVGVEDKGLTLTLHWRSRPEGADWALAFAAEQVARTGMVAQPGRMSVELRPPIDTDKGTVVRELGAGYRHVWCFGDDLGDLPAFAALDTLERRGVATLKVAVVDPEGPDQVAAAADLTVEGPSGALALLEELTVGPGPQDGG